jgi:hypothetical protein
MCKKLYSDGGVRRRLVRVVRVLRVDCVARVLRRRVPPLVLVVALELVLRRRRVPVAPDTAL